MILDSTPIIHISKSGNSWIFEKFPNLIIPKSIYVESVEIGKSKCFEDAEIIKRLVDSETISVYEIKNRSLFKEIEKLTKKLDIGEIEVLTLSKENKDIAIIDDAPAREIAKILNIKARGSMYLFTDLYKRKIITKKQLINCFEDMVKSGWRLSGKDYINIRNKLETLR